MSNLKNFFIKKWCLLCAIFGKRFDKKVISSNIINKRVEYTCRICGAKKEIEEDPVLTHSDEDINKNTKAIDTSHYLKKKKRDSSWVHRNNNYH